MAYMFHTENYPIILSFVLTWAFGQMTDVSYMIQIFHMCGYNVLARKWYENLVNMGQDKIIPDLRVEVFIKETLPLKAVEVPQLLQSNEVDGSTRDLRGELEQGGELTDWSEGLSHVVYQPTSEEQQAAQQEGVSGQFKVKYQVEMKPEGEVQVN